MNISDAIQILRKHNISGASVLRITEGKVTEHELLDYVLNACDQFIAEREEYKRLLKAAVNDINFYVDCFEACCDECCCDHDNHCHWKHEAEALKLIGGETDEKP